MFLCNDCADKLKVDSIWKMIASRSLGNCENCGKGAVCYDIHHSKIPVPKKKKKV